MDKILIFCLSLSLFSCFEGKDKNESNDSFVIAFGSCDNQNLPNVYRITEVVSDVNFGVLIIDFKTNKVSMEIRGENNLLLQKIVQKY